MQATGPPSLMLPTPLAILDYSTPIDGQVEIPDGDHLITSGA